ncbi:NUDIX domain-containing protein [Candidatus Pacearchaeota archaeon]|nr:NUDIX domain-containing protein [Candidatus Pacearchaeota archaeon]
MRKEALVVPRDKLFKEKYLEKGFSPKDEYDYMPIALKNYRYEFRSDDLENDFSLKQIITYVLIINPWTKKIFAYRRSANEKLYSEKRLYNRWSCGVGGHIERQDDADPIKASAKRELQEEVVMENYPDPKIVGFVNDDTGDVEKYHFGVVAIAETDEDEISMGDGEIEEGKFMTIEEIEELVANSDNKIERWTLQLLPYLKKHLG